jgi:hypothetical protein
MTSLAHASKLATSSLPVPTAWYAIPLRLIVGFGFMQHGYAKFVRGPEDFINVLHAIGVPFPFLMGWATIIVEFIGGVAHPSRCVCHSCGDTDDRRPGCGDNLCASSKRL